MLRHNCIQLEYYAISHYHSLYSAFHSSNPLPSLHTQTRGAPNTGASVHISASSYYCTTLFPPTPKHNLEHISNAQKAPSVWLVNAKQFPGIYRQKRYSYVSLSLFLSFSIIICFRAFPKINGTTTKSARVADTIQRRWLVLGSTIALHSNCKLRSLRKCVVTFCVAPRQSVVCALPERRLVVGEQLVCVW